MAGARVREVPLSYVGTLLAGIAIGILLAEFGDLFLRFPVESVLVLVLVCSVVVLGWACREMLHELVQRSRRGRGGRGGDGGGEPAREAEPDLDWPDVPRLLLHRDGGSRPNGVRR
ncbi:hypothetical protein VSH64_27630 [Amycolatopsis rhabdoformis]|uniref:AtpZ/AtpI family protein n=1 Tax=Amycolatopsis rhabdoformis TaxID=1448059 RepID=A0ABZ1HWZ1_9PSEU|nr:hypothetical protein [Amycolatopsis rhabdoformis]WSE26652.1 hypothetical protein VSH64_27630 [Amycolatopsis rhabdoformis]